MCPVVPRVTRKRRSVAALGVRLTRWDDAGGYDVCDRRSGTTLGFVAKRDGRFHARRDGAELGGWPDRWRAVRAVLVAAKG